MQFLSWRFEARLLLSCISCHAIHDPSVFRLKSSSAVILPVWIASVNLVVSLHNIKQKSNFKGASYDGTGDDSDKYFEDPSRWDK